MSRQRGCMVQPLADSVYTQDGHTLIDRYARGVNPHTGETFLIHYEGVGYPVRPDKPWRFNDYIDTAPVYTEAEVLAFPTREPVDLADWVRTFGARLESNFWLNYHALTKEEGDE